MSLASQIRAKAAEQNVHTTIGIASLIKVTTGAIKHVLNGTGTPSRQTTEAIARFLGRPVEEVSTISHEAPSLGKTEELPLVIREYEVAVLRASLVRIALSYGIEKPAVVQNAEDALTEAREGVEAFLINRALGVVPPRTLMTLKRLTGDDMAVIGSLATLLAQGIRGTKKAIHALESSLVPKQNVEVVVHRPPRSGEAQRRSRITRTKAATLKTTTKSLQAKRRLKVQKAGKNATSKTDIKQSEGDLR